MTHPSIQGLREAVELAMRGCICSGVTRAVDEGPLQECPRHGDDRATAEAMLIAQAAYLTEHGVLLSGEGLVREVGQATCTTVYIGQRYDRWDLIIRPDAGVRKVVGLVPVPQNGET